MAIRRSSSRSRAAPVPPAPQTPPTRQKSARPTAEHCLALLPTYWGKAHPVEVVNDFVQRVRGDCSPEDIRKTLLPAIPGQTFGTTGLQAARLRAALERVAQE